MVQLQRLLNAKSEIALRSSLALRNRRTDGRTNRRSDERMDGRTEKRTDRRKDYHSFKKARLHPSKMMESVVDTMESKDTVHRVIRPSVRPSVHPSIRLSVRPSVARAIKYLGLARRSLKLGQLVINHKTFRKTRFCHTHRDSFSQWP